MSKVKLPKKVGLALGGGAAKGLAHIGVIKVFEEAGIEVSYIAGTSMGALVGGWYAATKDIGFLERLFLNLEKKDMYPAVHMLRKKDGKLFKNDFIMKALEKGIEGMDIKDCKIPFAAVATDVENGDEVILKKGNLRDAIQASTALPIIFPPAKINERLLMDGGFVNPVPADVVKAIGADFVVAVDVSSRWSNLEEATLNPMKVYSVMSRALSIIEYQLARRILKKADVVIAPPVLGYKWFGFSDAKEIIACGEREAKKKLKEIHEGSGISPRKKKPFEKFMDFILYSD